MCGIVGVTGSQDSLSILINGLKRLEYRGYDSAGVYVNDNKGNDYLVKRAGRISNLEDALTDDVHGMSELVILGGLLMVNQMKLMLTLNILVTNASTLFTTG